MNFSKIIESLLGTTQNVQTIAAGVQYAQSPEVRDAVRAASQLMQAQLALQAVSTAALVVMAILAWRRS